MSAAKPCLGYPSRTAAVAAMQAQGMNNGAIAAAIGVKSSIITALAGKAQRPQKRLTSDQIDELIELRESGWSYDRIARRLGVTAGAVHYQCLRHGVVSPNQRLTEVPAEQQLHVTRTGLVQRRFTIEEDQRLLALEAEGLPLSEICRRLGRSNTSVRMRLMMLASREELA